MSMTEDESRLSPKVGYHYFYGFLAAKYFIVQCITTTPEHSYTARSQLKLLSQEKK